MPDRVVVEVDEGLSDLIPGFLTHKRADITAIVAAIARGDYAEIASIAHRIKGEGGSYGFDGISEIGAEIERAATEQDRAAVLRCAHELTAYLDSVEIVFE
jgi:HPt (histidine-containing phosphotransfer) domain-containing protein